MLAGATVALWFVVLSVLLPGVALGFNGFIIGKRPSVLERISARRHTSSAVASEMNIIEATADIANQNQDETISCQGDRIDGDGDEISVLLCPSAYPSRTFAAPNLEISYLSFESEDSHGDRMLELLPLQKYHARAQKRKRRNGNNNDLSSGNLKYHNSIVDNDLFIGKSNSAIRHDIPSLDFIYENQSRFQITKSSQVLLEEYNTHKKSCIFDIENSNTSESKNTNDDSSLEERLKFLDLLEGRLRSKIRAECRASLPLSIQDTLQVLYCDSHICVVNKPSGVLSVPGHRRNPSLACLVYDTIQPSSCSNRDDGSIDAVDQSVVHRLDMATSGIIVYALSKEALQKLHVTFRDRKVQKTYQALVEGHLLCDAMEGEIDVALERDPTNPPYMRVAQPREEPKDESSESDSESDENAKSNNDSQQPEQHKFWREAPKPSKTTWSILGYEHDKDGKPLTRVALKPHTGRTHQLRVHTSSVLGTPIVGDDIYGSGTHDPNTNMCLHAQRLCIHHPITGAPMIFEADPPF